MRKYTELLSIPAALLLVWLFNMAATALGVSIITPDMVGKVFAAFVLYLIALAFVRISHRAIFPQLYRYFDPSFNENKNWKLWSEKERSSYSFWLHIALLALFGLILSGL